MKISYNWLKKYIDTDVSPEKMGEILTDCGLEVEGMEKIQSIKGGLDGLVVGEVLSKEKHPDADRLNLTKVDIGGDQPLDIVCGAPNVDEGQKVVVATVGTTLYPMEGEEFKIKKSKIRGALSEGMLCAEDEIGLGKGHDGIMVLNSETKVGTTVKDYFNIEDDVVFEIGLTPNRADATGHIGVARDLKTVLNLSKKVNLKIPSVDNFKVDNNNLKIEVEVQDAELCPRYSGITISNVEVKDSPDWLQNKLKSIGLTPINNIVDATNFVLHETGQPLHAFDYDKVLGKKIIVKTVAKKTKFITLDEKERELSENDLMICNKQTPMCIAGVFGGVDSGVMDSTRNIFIESAYFNPVTVRKTAKRHALNTDASFRFERGADPNITVYALKRVALLIKEIAGGKISSDLIDVYPKPIENFTVEFNFNNCDRLIGESIDRGTIKNILNDLDIEIITETNDGLILSVPPFKVDVQREADVIEEVLRIYGYNQIKLPQKLQSSLSYRQKPDKEKITNLLAELLIANGFNEMLSNSLTNQNYYINKESLVEISNPLSKELEVLRQSMLFNGLETIRYNQNRKISDLKLFEFGKVYQKTAKGFKETSQLSIFLTGNSMPENWNTTTNSVNFYELKGLVNLMIERFGIQKLKIETKETNNEELGYGLDLFINDLLLVEFGRVTDIIQAKFDLNNEIFYANFNYDNFIKLSSYTSVTYKEVSKFPAVRRDLAMLLDYSVSYFEIESIAFKQERKLLKNVNLFDVYEGKNIEKGKKSYGVSFIFQDETKTLTDQQVDKIMEKLIQSLTSELGAQLR